MHARPPTVTRSVPSGDDIRDPLLTPRGPTTLVLSIAALVLCLAMMAVGGLMHTQGGPGECPDWPLCKGTALPEMRGRVLVEYGHRFVANVLALAMLGLATALARRVRERSRRWWRIGAFGVVLVVVQGALLSRAGVLVSIHRRTGEFVGREPEVLVLAAAGVAVAVLATAWALRRQDPLAGMGLVACELVEATSALGAAMVFLQRPPWVVLAHSALSLAVIGYLAVIAVKLGAPCAAWPRSRAAAALGGVAIVVVFGILVRHLGAAWAVPHWAMAVASVAAAGAVWPVVRRAWEEARSHTLWAGGLGVLLLPVQVAVGVGMVRYSFTPAWRTLHQLIGAALLAAFVALLVSLSETRSEGAR